MRVVQEALGELVSRVVDPAADHSLDDRPIPPHITDTSLADTYLLRRTLTDQDAGVDKARQAYQEKQGEDGNIPYQDNEAGVLDIPGNVVKDVATGLTIDLPRRVLLGGVRDAVQESLKTVDALGDWANEHLADLSGLGEIDIGTGLPDVAQPRSVTGGLLRSVSQFLTGFLGGNRILKTVGAPAYLGGGGAAAVSGAVSNAVVFDAKQERLSNLVQQFPALQNPVNEYLAASPDDTTAEGKFKSALEGLGLGVMTDGMVLALRSIRAGSAARQAAERIEATKAGTTPAVSEPLNLAPLGRPDKPTFTLGDIPQSEAEGWLSIDPEEEGGKAVNINLAYLDTPDDIKDAIGKTAKMYAGRIEEARRGVKTNVATRELADNLGMTVDTLLQRRSGQAFNAEEALGARRLLVASGENLMASSKKASAANAGDVDKFAFRRMLSVHLAIQEQVSGMTAEAGRSLQQFRIMASGAAGQAKAIKEALELADGKVPTEQLALMVSKLDRPEALNTFARQASKATTTDMLLEAWLNGLLSGPQTHVVNTLSNSLYAFWQIPERALAAQFRQLSGGDGVAVGEATAQVYGAVKGMRDGLTLAWDAVKKGEPSDAMAKIELAKHRAITKEALEVSGSLGRAVDLLGETVRLPGRFLMAEDEFFKSVGYRMELHALAFRQASSEGLTGEKAAKRIAGIIANPPEHISLAAMDAGRYQTFTKSLGPTGSTFQALMNKAPALRVVFPFVRTPINIMKGAGERTPLAFMSKAIRADIAAGGARRDLALAKISLGSMVMATVADFAASGQITGGGPTNPHLRAAKIRQGWRPYSVLIDGTYYAYNRADPLGTVFGVAADMTDMMGQLPQNEADDAAAALVMAISNNVINKTWMESLSQAVALFNQVSPEVGTVKGEAYIKNLLGTAVPSLFAQIERAVDPTVRDTHSGDLMGGVLNQIKSRVPGWSNDLPPVRNFWGEPVELKGGLGPDIMSPIYTSEIVTSPVDEEIERLQLPLAIPGRLLAPGVELSPQEYDRYIELFGHAAENPATGAGLKATLETVIATPQYRHASDGPDGGKARILSEYVHVFKLLAKTQLLMENPDLAALVKVTADEQAALLK